MQSMLIATGALPNAKRKPLSFRARPATFGKQPSIPASRRTRRCLRSRTSVWKHWTSASPICPDRSRRDLCLASEPGVIHQWPPLDVWPGLILDANPGHIRAQILAADKSLGDLFDSWAPAQGHRPVFGTPLMHGDGRDSQERSQRPLASEYFAGAFDFAHSHYDESLPIACQVVLPSSWFGG